MRFAPFALSLILVAFSGGAARGAPLVTVNDVPISEAVAELIVKEQVAQGQTDDAALRALVREELIKWEVVEQEARKLGLDQSEVALASIEAARQRTLRDYGPQITPELETRMAIARSSVLRNIYLTLYVSNHPVSEAAKQAEYQRRIRLVAGFEYKVRHVLLSTELEAIGVIRKLLTGTRFDALAAISIDSGSNRAGGDLGWVRLSSLDPSLKGVVESLGAGNFTLQPVRTEFGYHVVLVEDVRPIGVPRYEDLRDSITQQLTRELLVGHIADLKDRSKLVY